MAVLTTKRADKIKAEQENIRKAVALSVSNLIRDLNRVKVMGAWAYTNALAGGDLDLADLEVIRSEYNAQAPQIRAMIPLLDDLESIRVLDVNGNVDLAATQSALDAFVAKYNLAGPVAEYDAGFGG